MKNKINNRCEAGCIVYESGSIKHHKDCQHYPEYIEEKKELLCDFFKFFRDNGEANIGMSIEQFVEMYLNEKL